MSQQGEGQAGQQGQGEGAPDPQLLSAKFSEGYNAGVLKAEKDLQTEIQKRFGAASFDDLGKQLETLKSKGAPDHVAQVEKLTGQITELSNAHSAERLNWRIQSAMSGLDPHNPSLTAQQIQREYDIQVDDAGRETVYPKGSREIIVLDGKPATLRDLVQSLTKNQAYSWQFRSGSTQVQGGQQKSGFNDDMLKDPKFVAALRGAGEYFNFINGKPVNESAVKALLNKN